MKKETKTSIDLQSVNAPQQDGQGLALQTGTVKALLTVREAMVSLSSGEQIHAEQAAGCLLAPNINDTVLIYDGPDGAFILSVLTRERAVPAVLSVPNADQVMLKSDVRLEVAAPDLVVNARRFNLLAETVTQTGKQLMSNFSRSLETLVDKIVNARSITTTATTRTSAIKEAETLKAGILVQNIDSVATQNSDISMVTAKEDVRLDAKRVSVG